MAPQIIYQREKSEDKIAEKIRKNKLQKKSGKMKSRKIKDGKE